MSKMTAIFRSVDKYSGDTKMIVKVSSFLNILNILLFRIIYKRLKRAMEILVAM